MRLRLGLGLGLGRRNGGGAAAGGSFTDDFTDLDAWTIYEAGSGTAAISGGRLRVSGAGHVACHETSHQIPATWQTITLTFRVGQNSGWDCEWYAGLCMDSPPTGDPHPLSNEGTVMQNGYSCLVRAAFFSDRMTRFNAGAKSTLRDTNDVTPPTDASMHVATITFTKLADRVQIDRTYNGVALGTTYDDTSADRLTGACYVFLAGYVSGTQVEYDDLNVIWT